ncbi:hypothetical protein BN1195_00244 [Chryseobacterium oranimense G311]|uniref:RHS repeat-associated core domain-containing protein n=1 Tax=Chryseobacterium oranimense TaxID=421058 RepID=UPI0005336EFF|nr:hypothetical protein BN1195_00244 [Chryseobacterium oranimense G311]
MENHRNSNHSPYKFNGKELDAETGYYYYGARYYNPRVSLWLNVDPLADYNPFYNREHYIDGEHNAGVYNSGNLNPYIFTYQNPIKFVDPNGKQNVVTQKSLGDKIWDFLESIADPDGDAIQYRRVSSVQKPLERKDFSYAKQSRALSGMKGIHDLVVPDADGLDISASAGPVVMYSLYKPQDNVATLDGPYGFVSVGAGSEYVASGTASVSIDPKTKKGTWLSVSGNVGFGYTGSELSGATVKGGAGYTVIFMQPWDPKKHGNTINLPSKPEKSNEK